MITYELSVEEGKEPQLLKVITVGSESFSTALEYMSKTELEAIDASVIRQHIDNLGAYIRGLASGLEVFPDEIAVQSPWPVKNLEKVLEAADKLSNWWSYIYTREEAPELFMQNLTASAPIDGTAFHETLHDLEHQAMHDEGTPHTHSEETGEVIADADAAHTHDYDGGAVTFTEEATTSGETV